MGKALYMASLLGKYRSQRWLWEVKKIQVLERRSGVPFFHDAAAGTVRILSFHCAACFYENHTLACCARAMPMFTGFHFHGLHLPSERLGQSIEAVSGTLRGD